ncbi:MAG: tetratricopeptide repeat protein [Syntrophales bacterium]|nr:tetratricopeptide repeat protein [Syntrophales bacterium]
MKKRLAAILFLCLSFLLPAGEAAAAETQPGQLHAYLRQGIESSFNLDHAGAIFSFQKAVELDRKSPTGYAFLALAQLFSYETGFDPMEREKSREAMLRYVGDAVARGEKRIAKNPRDSQSYFALTLAKIVKVRLALMQKSYFMVARESGDLWDYLEKTRTADPDNYDIYFPMGLLHYHLDQLPGVTRFLSSMLITAGDHHRGIQELELAVQKGDLFRELAQAELSSVYINYERQPALALAMTVDLRERFPRNYNFSFSLAIIFSELGRFDEAYAIARDLEKGIQAGSPPFAPQLQSRYDHLLGRILFNQREYARAGEYFQKALKDAAPYNARVRASALLRLGMIHDVRQERKRAEEYYNRVLEVEGGEGVAQVDARRYLKTPYVPSPKNPGS